MRAILVVVMATLSMSASAQTVPLPTSPQNPPTEPTQPAPTSEAPAATPEPVDPEIERSARIARSLARDGHCDVALEYGKTIEAKAPTYYAQVFVADPDIAACIAGTAPRPSQPAAPPAITATENVEPLTEGVCRRARLYVAPSLLFASGSTYTNGTGGSVMTSSENTFHRIAAGGVLRLCSDPQSFSEERPYFDGRIGATAVANAHVAGFGLEAEIDYGASYMRGGLRLEVELGLDSRLATAGARVHFYDTVFLGIDAYSARDAAYTSHGTMLGFGLEGRVGRWAAATEAVLGAIFFVVIIAGGGPD